MALFDVAVYIGKSVSEVLDLPVEEIRTFWVHMNMREGRHG